MLFSGRFIIIIIFKQLYFDYNAVTACEDGMGCTNGVRLKVMEAVIWNVAVTPVRTMFKTNRRHVGNLFRHRGLTRIDVRGITNHHILS